MAFAFSVAVMVAVPPAPAFGTQVIVTELFAPMVTHASLDVTTTDPPAFPALVETAKISSPVSS